MTDKPAFVDLKWRHHRDDPPRKRAEIRPDELVEVWLHPGPLFGQTLGHYKDGKWRKVGYAEDFRTLERLYNEVG